MTRKAVAPRVDLDVTPLIDVLLVLLVIFMATVPLAQQSLDTKVPHDVQDSSVESPAPPAQIVVSCELGGEMAINHSPVAIEDLGARLRAIYDTRTDKTLYVMGDPGLRYRSIVQIIDIAKGAGVSRVGVITAGMRAEKRPA